HERTPTPEHAHVDVLAPRAVELADARAIRGQQRARDVLLHRVARQLPVAGAAFALLATEAMPLAVRTVEDRLRQSALELAAARLETDGDDGLRTARGGALGLAGHRSAIAVARAEDHGAHRSQLDRHHEPIRRGQADRWTRRRSRVAEPDELQIDAD